MDNLFYPLAFLLLVNARAYYLMVKDKRIAIRNADGDGVRMRIPEKRLLLNAALLGFGGIGLGMLPPVNHKKRKPRFRYGVPAIAVLEMGLLAWLAWAFRGDLYFALPW